MDTWTNLLVPQNIKINRFKASKTILTNQRLCYAQLDQATETLQLDQATVAWSICAEIKKTFSGE